MEENERQDRIIDQLVHDGNYKRQQDAFDKEFQAENGKKNYF